MRGAQPLIVPPSRVLRLILGFGAHRAPSEGSRRWSTAWTKAPLPLTKGRPIDARLIAAWLASPELLSSPSVAAANQADPSRMGVTPLAWMARAWGRGAIHGCALSPRSTGWQGRRGSSAATDPTTPSALRWAGAVPRPTTARSGQNRQNRQHHPAPGWASSTRVCARCSEASSSA